MWLILKLIICQKTWNCTLNFSRMCQEGVGYTEAHFKNVLVRWSRRIKKKLTMGSLFSYFALPDVYFHTIISNSRLISKMGIKCFHEYNHWNLMLQVKVVKERQSTENLILLQCTKICKLYTMSNTYTW